jgi:hypothetical protein
MRLRQFVALFALGFVGVLSLLPVVIDVVGREPLPPRAPPPAVIVALSVIQSSVLLAIAVAVGLRFAPRLGFRSYVVAAAGGAPVWPALRRDAPLSMGVGAATMVVVVLLDLAFRPFMGDAWRRLEETQNALTRPGPALVMGILYGGITEELLLRWGMLSLFAWLGWRFGRRTPDGAARPAVVWTAIFASALLFGVGHLPAVAAFVPLTPVLVVRTILLNALAGVAFGWLFWRRSLESAMIAHATGHVVLFVVRVASR